jgi:hypothetical protein
MQKPWEINDPNPIDQHQNNGLITDQMGNMNSAPDLPPRATNTGMVGQGKD